MSAVLFECKCCGALPCFYHHGGPTREHYLPSSIYSIFTSSDVFSVKFANDTVCWLVSGHFSSAKYRKKNWGNDFWFQTSRKTQQEVVTNGQCIEVVNDYRYPGTVIDVKLSLDFNTGVIYIYHNYILCVSFYSSDTASILLFILPYCFIAHYFRQLIPKGFLKRK